MSGRAPTFLLLFLAFGILAMLAVPAKDLFTDDKAAHNHPPQASSGDAPAAAKQGPPSPGAEGERGMALSGDEAQALTGLMQKLKEKPEDPDTLAAIGRLFFDAGEWAQATAFLNRAVLARPGAAEPLSLLAVSLYKQNQMPEAAAAYEQFLSLRQDPAARFNLAVLYAYHLREPQKARALLESLANDEDADAQVRARARGELEKLQPAATSN